MRCKLNFGLLKRQRTVRLNTNPTLVGRLDRNSEVLARHCDKFSSPTSPCRGLGSSPTDLLNWMHRLSSFIHQSDLHRVQRIVDDTVDRS